MKLSIFHGHGKMKRPKALTEQSTERCGVLSTSAAVAFGTGSCQSSFHYTAWPKHSSSAMYRQLFLCLCFPKMMNLYKKTEGNWPSHWEVLVLLPNPVWASEHQYSEEVKEEHRSNLWSAFLHGFPPFLKSRGEITRLQMCSVEKGVECIPSPLVYVWSSCQPLARFIHLRPSSVLEILVFNLQLVLGHFLMVSRED